jgi:Tfp pilus assembly protein PilO
MPEKEEVKIIPSEGAERPLTPSLTKEGEQGGVRQQAKRPSKLFTDYYGSVFLLLMAAYVAVGFFIIKPKIDANKGIEAETRALRQQIDNDKTYFDGLSGSVAAAQSISPDVLVKVDQAMPREASIPDLLVQLSAASQGTGVTLTNVVFEGTGKIVTAAAASQAINMTMTIAAKDYGALKNFLSALETSLRIFDVQTINAAGFEGDKVNFTLQVKSYYYPSK